MHGGGNTSSRRAPRYFMNFLTSGTEAESSQLGDVFAETGMIAVGPSAPWDRSTSYRWCLREAEEYLADVIAECKTRFNIDPHRIFLIGHSMGGFGAYHHTQRQPDRFAGVIVNSGSWSQAYLPAIRGTSLCIIQGVNDARKGVRWHYTDIEYARWTHKLLKSANIDHTYFEHDGKHSVSYGRKYIAKFLKASQNTRRDPYYPHVTLASPSGFRKGYCSPVIHNRWLTLNESTKGELEFDALLSNGEEDFEAWQLEHHVTKRSGSAIDAKNNGDNSITVSTQNVKRFTLWLHPKMVDITKPVKVIINGKTTFTEKVTPSLATALESYERRDDWGLIYPIKIELTVPRSER
jgi:pimeloyl-ACP methyl ester carboxylesterase